MGKIQKIDKSNGGDYGLIALPRKIVTLLQCPICHSKVDATFRSVNCVNPRCRGKFPVVDSVPIMIHESNSIFTIKDCRSRLGNINRRTRESNARFIFYKVLPRVSTNLVAAKNYQRFAKLLLRFSRRPRVLVLGGRILGKGMEPLLKYSAIELIESDIAFGPRAKLICDAHDIPFEDNSFDGVVVQAVLEHVIDPARCVSEIHRVLKTGGLVYAETPFMQQVHDGRYDFNRYSKLGHRRLFRHFQEVTSGPVGGPGSALAWSLKYFLLSFTTVRLIRVSIVFISHWLFWGLKYFDYLLANKPAALDAAFGYYFMGKKSDKLITDRKILKLYRGGE